MVLAIKWVSGCEIPSRSESPLSLPASRHSTRERRKKKEKPKLWKYTRAPRGTLSRPESAVSGENQVKLETTTSRLNPDRADKNDCEGSWTGIQHPAISSHTNPPSEK